MVITNNAANIKNKNLVIPVDATTIPLKENTPAISANTKKINDELNIIFPP